VRRLSAAVCGESIELISDISQELGRISGGKLSCEADNDVDENGKPVIVLMDGNGVVFGYLPLTFQAIERLHNFVSAYSERQSPDLLIDRLKSLRGVVEVS
jgi:hypothetical protein